MTDQLEQQLRQHFAEEAQAAPTAVGLAEHARRQARHSRRTHLTWGAGLLVAASVVGGAALSASDPQPPTPYSQTPSAAPAPTGPLGEVEGASLASCAFEYTPATLAERAFAFDGTVTAVTEPGTGTGTGTGEDRAGTTFTVNEWFSGGASATVTIDMPPPSTQNGLSEVPPTYEIGSRLLISGEHLRGGATMADAVAWGCGFSRYYDAETAGRWREVTS